MPENPNPDSKSDSAEPKPGTLTPEQVRAIAAEDRRARAAAAEVEIVAVLQKHQCDLAPEVATVPMPGGVYALRAGFRIVPR